MADIKTTKDLVRLCRASGISLYIWGSHGLGKSSLVRQVAHDEGIAFVDFRLAQIDSADLKGLPAKTTDGCTQFLPPSELPRDGQGILCLDELNRADQSVLAAAFQLVLDRRIGEYRLPDGWSIVCAGNFDDGSYSVNSLDPALVDRFCHVTLSHGEATFGEWVDWMVNEHGEQAAKVISFCGANLSHLEFVESTELGFEIRPSRRSWAMATRVLEAWETGEYSEEARLGALAGLVGSDLAISFSKFQSPIQPSQLIREGVKRYDKKIRKLSRQNQMSLMWGLISFLKNVMPDESVANVALDFAAILFDKHKDLALAFCTALTMESFPENNSVSREQCLAFLKNRILATAFAKTREQTVEPPSFIDRLAGRPALADTVAESLNVKISPEECV